MSCACMQMCLQHTLKHGVLNVKDTQKKRKSRGSQVAQITFLIKIEISFCLFIQKCSKAPLL